MVRIIVRLSLIFLLILMVGCSETPEEPGSGKSNQSIATTTRRENYQTRLENFTTNLLYEDPAPQRWQDEPLPEYTHEVHYLSDGLSLKAWVYVPDGDDSRKHPVLVYFHGGFAFGASDLEDCRPFIDAGYVIFCPMLRGENGNPGNFELMMGEVADAGAAVKWIAEQTYVDRNRIFAFGHSAGGAISALLSLRRDIPVKHSGSSGGLYGSGDFYGWSDIVPYDLSDPKESEMRSLVGHLTDLQFPHYAYLGTEEYLDDGVRATIRESQRGDTKLAVVQIEGDHFTSLRPSMLQYLMRMDNSKKN